MRRALVAVVAVIALVGSGIACAFALAPQTASCTPSPTITPTGNRRVATVVCDFPYAPSVTKKFTATATATPTPTPSPTPTPTPSPSPSVTPTPTPTPTVTPTTATPTPTPTSTPTAPAAGFPDSSNTGYRNAPGYTGTLKSSAGLNIVSGGTYVGYDFPGGIDLGSRTTPLSNVTFIGCRFKGSGDVLVRLYGSNFTFSYTSFEPNVAAPPATNAQGYQYGISADGAYYTHAEGLSMDHVDMWGFANALALSTSTQAKPFTIRDSWIHDARDDGGVDHTDGIGELQSNSMSFVTIDHNTIVSKGNTNGIAFQGGPYSDFTVTNNLIGGWGYAVRIGWPGTTTSRITFTGNQWTDTPPAVFGPLYSTSFTTGNGNLWRNNRWSDGRFWTPSGPSATDFTG